MTTRPDHDSAIESIDRTISRIIRPGRPAGPACTDSRSASARAANHSCGSFWILPILHPSPMAMRTRRRKRSPRPLLVARACMPQPWRAATRIECGFPAADGSRCRCRAGNLVRISRTTSRSLSHANRTLDRFHCRSGYRGVDLHRDKRPASRPRLESVENAKEGEVSHVAWGHPLSPRV